MTTKKQKRKVVIISQSRPWTVVHGVLESQNGQRVVLSNARCIVYYDSASKSAIGIATNGVSSRARVAPAVARLEMLNTETVNDCNDVSSATIEAEPWG